MKLHYRILIVMGLLVSFQQALMAQSNSATATGHAAAHVVKPISLQAKHTLNYGTFTAPSAGNGSITLSATGVGGLVNQNAPPVTPTTTGGVATVNTIQTSGNGGSPVELATFQVIGEPGYTFQVTVPSGPVNVLPSVSLNGLGAIKMTLSAFTTNLASNAGAIGTGPVAGYRYFAVGATLMVNQNQASGDYNGTFSVTVNYN
jgi:hypothetical protein